MSEIYPEQGARPKRRWGRTILFLMAVIVLAAGGFWYWEARDNLAYQKAIRLLEADKYQEAEAAFVNFLAVYPDSPFASEAEDQLPALYLKWAEDLTENAQYEESIQKLSTILVDHSKSQQAAKAKTMLVENSIRWSRQCVENGDHEKAVLVLEEALLILPRERDLHDGFIDAKIQWAEYLSEEREFAKAYEILDELNSMYSNDSRSAEINAAYIETAIQWCGDLRNRNEFETCSSILENALKKANNDGLDSELLKTHLEWGEYLIDSGYFEEGVERFNITAVRWQGADEILVSSEKIIETLKTRLEQTEDASVRDALGDVYMLLGRYWIAMANLGTQKSDHTQTRANWKDARSAFENALSVKPDDPIAAEWLRLLDLNVDELIVIVIYPGQTLEVSIALLVDEPIVSALFYETESKISGGEIRTSLESPVELIIDKTGGDESMLRAADFKVSFHTSSQISPGVYKITLSTDIMCSGCGIKGINWDDPFEFFYSSVNNILLMDEWMESKKAAILKINLHVLVSPPDPYRAAQSSPTQSVSPSPTPGAAGPSIKKTPSPFVTVTESAPIPTNTPAPTPTITQTFTPSATSCSSILDVSLDKTPQGIYLHVHCPGNYLYQLGPLAKGAYAISPNGKFLVYCTNSGDLFTSRADEESLRFLENIREKLPILRSGEEPALVITFFTSEGGQYWINIRDSNSKQNIDIKIPHSISD